MKECKDFALYIWGRIEGLCYWIAKKTVRSMFWVDRYIIKRYLGLETPLYKIWWRDYSERIQDELNLEHGY